MNNTLFNEFEPVSAKAWKQKIQADLKGADYNDTLIWKTNEGIDVKPFYHEDEMDTLFTTTSPNFWAVGQTIFVANTQKSNDKAIDAIKRGAESLTFIIPDTSVSIETLLNTVNRLEVKLYFKLQFLSQQFVKKIRTIAKHRVFIFTDIINNLAKDGNWFSNLKNDYTTFDAIIKDMPQFSVDLSLYQNAGATIIQQLAYGLAHANDYLNHLNTKKNISVIFNVAIGTNYFFEIAKLRALRILWQTLISEYNCSSSIEIIATPTKRNKTLYDYNTNMLRTTTECMSAILGGANTVCNLPYDAIYHKDNEFGERISRNQLLILKHESYLDNVSNPSDGSYYIESLTQQLAEKALSLFKDIETNGGFLKQLKEGNIQKKIKESANKEKEQFNDETLILLGTNKHPNAKDRMKADLELYPFVKIKPRKTLIEPIIEKRLAEELEQKRLETEQ